jgi:hypothetical protein
MQGTYLLEIGLTNLNNGKLKIHIACPHFMTNEVVKVVS